MTLRADDGRRKWLAFEGDVELSAIPCQTTDGGTKPCTKTFFSMQGFP